MSLALLVVLSTTHYEGDVSSAGGDYAEIPFEVPAGSVECQVAHTDGSDQVILDWGIWSPDGFRGWGGGLTDDAIIGVAQSSRGYLPGPITPGTWTLVIGKALLPAGTGHYAVDVTCRDTATLPVLPKAAYTPVVMSPDRRWYRGDFHVHSSESGDASASLQDNVDLAHMRGLDFINGSDHNTISQHALIAAAQPGWPILVMRSSEITTYSGHANGVGISQYVDHRLGYQGRTMADIFDDVAAQGGALIVNHPATDLGTNCIGCAWQHVDDVPWDEASGMEMLTAGYDLGEPIFTPLVVAMWDRLEDAGHRISAVGGSDDHTGAESGGVDPAPVGSPCTLVLADNLSEAAIVDAVKHHHTSVQLHGPDDPFVELTMATPSGTPAEVGDEVGGANTASLSVHVTAGNGTFVHIVRDGEQLAQLAVDSDDFTGAYTDTMSGDHRYRVELVDGASRRLVITSHIYARGLTGDDGGGGCSAGGASGLGSAISALALALRRRKRR